MYKHERTGGRVRHDSFDKRLGNCYKVFGEESDSYKLTMADSLRSQNKREGGLTPRQVEMLENWEADIAGVKEWKKMYTNSAAKREMFSFAALYFSDTGYFRRITQAYYADVEGYIPSAYIYNKLVENTYFQRWLPEVKAGPRFSVGDIVEGRAGNYDHASAVYLITKVLGKIDPCKGGRWYNGHVIKETGRYSYANSINDHGDASARGFREKDVKPLKKGKKKK
jgi:hypothetical protein